MPKQIDNRFNIIDQEVSKLEKKPKPGSAKAIIRSAPSGVVVNYTPFTELITPKNRF